MGSVELLKTAREAGLKVEARGDKLRIIGPKRSESLALEILARKDALMPLLRDGVSHDTPSADADKTPCGVGNGGIVTTPGHWARMASRLLSFVTDADRRADLRELFEERAGVCEYCGELDRDDAERIAYDELRVAMPDSQ